MTLAAYERRTVDDLPTAYVCQHDDLLMLFRVEDSVKVTVVRPRVTARHRETRILGR